MINLDLRIAGKITEYLYKENVTNLLMERRAYNYIEKYTNGLDLRNIQYVAGGGGIS